MDGIANITGMRTIPLKIGGKLYSLAPMILEGYAEREAYILSHRPNPLDLIKSLPADTPEELKAKLIENALSRVWTAQFATSEEVLAFDRSLHGMVWNLARALRKHHPEEATFERAFALTNLTNREEVDALVRAINGVYERDLLPNSTSPALTDTAPGSECRGPNSSGDSPKSTDGHPETSAS